MEKYKIKRNPKPLSDEQINRHKDFSKLLGDQQKLHRYKDGTKPLYKNPGLMGMMIVVGVVLLVLMLDKPEKEEQKVPTDSVAVIKADTGLQIPVDQNTETPADRTSQENVPQTTATNKSKTPAPTVTKTIGYEEFKVDPEKGGVFYTRSGVRLLVPVLAFSDQVRKEVTLQYKEEMLSSLKEDGLKMPGVTAEKIFQLYARESATGRAVNLSKPIVMEVVSPLTQAAVHTYRYDADRNEWTLQGKESIGYRFTIQANDSQFPELELLTDLAWELPTEAGKPTDFNYIFNRPWKSFSYKTTDKKELAVKGTNSTGTFKGVPDIAPILGDAKKDQKLREAFYTIYNFAAGRTTDEERQKQALQTINDWKNSKEGKQYSEWLKTEAAIQQFYYANKTSKIMVNTFGTHCISYTQEKASTLNPSRRILMLEKYPVKTQQYMNESEQN